MDDDSCTPGERCHRYGAGHNVHWIPATRAHASPELLRDAIVRSVEERVVVIDFLDGGSVDLWHHEDLGLRFRAGEPISLHWRYRLLLSAGGWINVRLVSPAGTERSSPRSGDAAR